MDYYTKAARAVPVRHLLGEPDMCGDQSVNTVYKQVSHAIKCMNVHVVCNEMKQGWQYAIVPVSINLKYMHEFLNHAHAIIHMLYRVLFTLGFFFLYFLQCCILRPRNIKANYGLFYAFLCCLFCSPT